MRGEGVKKGEEEEDDDKGRGESVGEETARPANFLHDSR